VRLHPFGVHVVVYRIVGEDILIARSAWAAGLGAVDLRRWNAAARFTAFRHRER
jgi:hypothetical protein